MLPHDGSGVAFVNVPEVDVAVCPGIEAGVHAVAEDAEVVEGVHVCVFVVLVSCFTLLRRGRWLLTWMTFASVFEVRGGHFWRILGEKAVVEGYI